MCAKACMDRTRVVAIVCSNKLHSLHLEFLHQPDLCCNINHIWKKRIVQKCELYHHEYEMNPSSIVPIGKK
jgi:hypothetical protein